jgi:hypothetical protein
LYPNSKKQSSRKHLGGTVATVYEQNLQRLGRKVTQNKSNSNLTPKVVVASRRTRSTAEDVCGLATLG